MKGEARLNATGHLNIIAHQMHSPDFPAHSVFMHFLVSGVMPHAK